MPLVGGGPPPKVPSALTAAGGNIQVVGSVPLRSAVPLGFAPSSSDAGPVLATWDVAGLDALPGLSGLYRTHSWLAPITIARLRWWQLAGVEARLERSQARLLVSGSQFSLSAPFTTLDEARAQASVAPQRLLTHSVITWAGLITLIAGWLAATALLGTLVLVRNARLTDMLAVATASALVAALAAGTGSDQALALAPLCCAAAGVLTFRAAGAVLRGAERVARGGPVLPRLALVNLARSPAVAALAIAFIAVATGLGGFALA